MISSINTGIIKIPTLLGMGVLLIGLAGGVYLVTQNQSLKSKAAISASPKNVNVINITDNSAAIFWQTDEPTIGYIQAGHVQQLNLNFRDDRDSGPPQAHKLHFVTLSNLTPETTYNYQIYSGAIVYSPQPDSFKTSTQLPILGWSSLVGTVIDANNQAIDEAIISLNLTGAQKLATIAKGGGNFILPLSSLKTTDLTNSFPTDKSPYTAKLEITGTAKNATATIFIPSQDIALAPIILGTNVDLTQNNQSASTQLTVATSSAEINKYDLNSDGVINYADLSIMLQNFGKTPNNPKADINGDGVVDQKDANLLIPYLK